MSDNQQNNITFNMLFEKDDKGNYIKIDLDFFIKNYVNVIYDKINRVRILNKDLQLDLNIKCINIDGNIYLSVTELSKIFNCDEDTIIRNIRNIFGNYLNDINLRMKDDLLYNSLRKKINPTFSICVAAIPAGTYNRTMRNEETNQVNIFNINLIRELAKYIKNEKSIMLNKYYDLLFMDSLYVSPENEKRKNTNINTNINFGYKIDNGKPDIENFKNLDISKCDIENFKNYVNEILSKRRNSNTKNVPMNGFVPSTDNTIGRSNVNPIYGFSSENVHIDDVDNCCENCQNSDDDHLYDENYYNEDELLLKNYNTVHPRNKNFDWDKLEKNIIDYQKQLDDYKNNMDKLYSDLKNEFYFLKNEFYF